jgi:hypothetical protein
MEFSLVAKMINGRYMHDYDPKHGLMDFGGVENQHRNQIISEVMALLTHWLSGGLRGSEFNARAIIRQL